MQSPHIAYPALNIFFSPRVSQRKINHKSIPMCIYTRKIESTNISKIFDQLEPDPVDLKELTVKDGLIYQFKQMFKKTGLKIKVLMCVCMYN